jgi:ADP-ribosyl-[dinitrogen reductase] hydrolase
MTPREIVAQHGTHDTICGGGWLRLAPGRVTDDTTMSLALGSSILEAGKVDALAAAQAFDAWMRAKPVDIGNTVRRNLIQFRTSGRPEAPCSDHDAGNGAAMRILPVALATLGQNVNAVRAACRRQGHVTHNNHLSDAASECLALMVQAALQGYDKNQLLHDYALPMVMAQPLFRFRGVRRRETPTGFIVDTMQAVFQSFYDTDDFRSCLVDVVNRGGDADTTGAIAGMLAGALYGLDAIPNSWLNALDDGVREACASQARLLVELAARQDTSASSAKTAFQDA